MSGVKKTLVSCLSVFESICILSFSPYTMFPVSDCREHLHRLDSYFLLSVKLYFPVLELHTYMYYSKPQSDQPKNDNRHFFLGKIWFDKFLPVKKTSPQAKRHKLWLLFTSFSYYFNFFGFYHWITFMTI